MRAGRLDRFITIQRNMPTEDTDGGKIDSWATLGQLRTPASVMSVGGDERFTSPQLVAQDQVEFLVRYSEALMALSPVDRIIYPAFEANSPAVPETRRIYDVLTVAEVGRREGLKIKTVRRSDVRDT